MKTLPQYLLMAICAQLISAGPVSGAAANEPSGPAVGGLGRKEALVFEGNKAFTREEILSGLCWHIDFLAAARPSAPLAEYTDMVQKMTRAGYRREGFPEAAITVTADTKTQRITVRIAEGPRFDCGDVRVTGLKTLTNAVVIQRLTDAVCGLDEPTGKDTNQFKAMWSKGEPAPFDDSARQALTDRVVSTLADMNYFRPKVRVTVAPDPARKVADLRIEILDEGIKGVISQIEVTGLEKNTQQQVLDYLKLRPGMELPARLQEGVSNALWNSARFLRCDATVTQLRQAGRFKLQLELVELEEVPALNQELSPEEKALLKFHEWFLNWESRPEDMVYSMGVTSPWLSANGDVVVSPAGLALITRGGILTTPNQLLYGGVASSRTMGLYSGWRRRKLAFERSAGTLSAFLHILPTPNPQPGQRFNLAVGAGATSKEALQPFRLDLKVAPAAVLGLAHEDGVVCSLENGVLTVKSGASPDALPVAIKIDAGTGRLISAGFENKRGYVRLRFEEGGFARTIKEISAAAASYPNEYAPARPFSSGVAFIAQDVIENPFLTAWLPGQSPALQAQWQALQRLWTRATNAGGAGLVRLFEPFDRLGWGQGTNDERRFDVPLDDVLAGGLSDQNVMAMAGTWVVKGSESVWRPESWPCILAREAGFLAAGRGRHSAAELSRLTGSDAMGPLACALAVKLYGKLSRELAEPFAVRGVAALRLTEFEKDCRVLLSDGSVSSQMASNALSMLSGLTDEEVNLLAGLPRPDDGAFLRQSLELLRAAKGRPFEEVLRPAFEQHWDKVIRPRLLAILDVALPLGHAPSTAAGQAQRGVLYAQGDGVKRDFDEAAKWFRKAAEQGHGEAQFHLAKLYEDGAGVPQDDGKALEWYEKAAAQKQPHAACAIGGFYRDGRGVKADPAEAAKWFRKEAVGECANAQVNLGLLTMPREDPQPWQSWDEAAKWFRKAADQGDARGQYYLGVFHEKTDVAEALKQYRLAAADGLRAAQAALAERLSDGFTTTPDYVEAYHWFSLAAAQGDRVARLALKRVERKLTPEQLEKAKKRAARAAAQQRAKQAGPSGTQ